MLVLLLATAAVAADDTSDWVGRVAFLRPQKVGGSSVSTACASECQHSRAANATAAGQCVRWCQSAWHHHVDTTVWEHAARALDAAGLP